MSDVDELMELLDEKFNKAQDASVFASNYLNDYLKRQDESLRLLKEDHQKLEKTRQEIENDYKKMNEAFENYKKQFKAQ